MSSWRGALLSTGTTLRYLYIGDIRLILSPSMCMVHCTVYAGSGNRTRDEMKETTM
jgi:hypothetical protein